MVTNPQKGDRVWTLHGDKPCEATITTVGTAAITMGECQIDFHGDTHKGYGHYWGTNNNLFPSLDALLSDLRERAVPLMNDNNLEDTK